MLGIPWGGKALNVCGINLGVHKMDLGSPFWGATKREKAEKDRGSLPGRKNPGGHPKKPGNFRRDNLLDTLLVETPPFSKRFGGKKVYTPKMWFHKRGCEVLAH